MTAIIQTKTSQGKYKTITKVFNDKKHYDNYISLLFRTGTKVIGTHVLSK